MWKKFFITKPKVTDDSRLSKINQAHTQAKDEFQMAEDEGSILQKTCDLEKTTGVD